MVYPASFTSNCQCAAWRSCFAWSAAQPAVRTNWLIITWCLSSSIFRRTPLAPTRGDWQTSDRFFPLFLRPGCVLCSSASVVHHYSSRVEKNTNIYCGSERRGRSLVIDRRAEPIRGQRRRWGLCSVSGWSRVGVASTVSLPFILPFLFASEAWMRRGSGAIQIATVSPDQAWPKNGVNLSSSNLRQGLFMTTTPISPRNVCKASGGCLFFVNDGRSRPIPALSASLSCQIW